MRGNGWQIAAITAIILVVALIVPLVIMGRGWSEMNDRMKAAEANQGETAQKAAKLDGENKMLKGLIGKEDTPSEDIRKQHDEDMTKTLPGENVTTQSYHAAVEQLAADLKKEQEAHRKTKEALEQFQSDYKNAQALYGSVVEKSKQELADTEKDHDQKQSEFDSVLKENGKKMAAQEARFTNGLASAKKRADDAEADLEKTKKDRDELHSTNETLAEQIDDIRNPNVEYPAGKILAIDQESGLAVVNVGSADGLLVRTMFSVYNAQVTGLSFAATTAGKKDPVYCDVCKREISLSTSKASVEVLRILGAHRAEVRILDDVLTDPIIVGDVVYSPIWKPGQVQRFALGANMTLPGVDPQSGYEMLRRLIEANGGIVDCWIDETPGEELTSDDRLNGSVSPLTSYVVVNEDFTGGTTSDVGDAEKRILERARNYAVRKISLQNLLNRMGWKNVTPEYDFGSSVFTKDMRVKPGEPRMSQGRTTDLFRPDDATSRISAKDMPTRPSSGRVSDNFSTKAPAVNPSNGKVSDMFKSRKPVSE